MKKKGKITLIIIALVTVGIVLFTFLFVCPAKEKITLKEDDKNIEFSVPFIGQLKKFIDSGKLEENLKSLNKGRIENKEAFLELTDKKIVYNEAVTGNKININKLKDYLVKNVNSISEIDLKDYYYPLDEDKNNIIKSEYDKYLNTCIEYVNTFKISLSDFSKYLSIENNEIVISCENKENWITEIEDLLNNNLNDFEGKFIKHNGEATDINFGNNVDFRAEAEYVFETLNNFASEINRTPLVSKGDYVELSISEQHVYIFKDGGLVADSPCVTGKCDGHETPKGVFSILNMGHNVGLRPSDSTTTSYVKNWMRFTTNGCGFHDASWRSEFGGDIYINNGSHGCCNLPTDFSDIMYELVYPGMPVIVY